MRELSSIPSEQNFCRVFEIPEQYHEGFCFGVGRPTQFKMVDWFQPFPTLSSPMFSELPEYWEQWAPRLREFVESKRYIRPGRKYLVLTDFDEAIAFTAAARKEGEDG